MIPSGFALFRSADGFPTKFAKALHLGRAEIQGGTASFRFDDLEPGRYAVAVFHDENANDAVDTNWLGIPREGLGVSNDAKSFMGPPRFDDAAVEVTVQGRAIVLTLRYL